MMRSPPGCPAEEIGAVNYADSTAIGLFSRLLQQHTTTSTALNDVCMLSVMLCSLLLLQVLVLCTSRLAWLARVAPGCC